MWLAAREWTQHAVRELQRGPVDGHQIDATDYGHEPRETWGPVLPPQGKGLSDRLQKAIDDRWVTDVADEERHASWRDGDHVAAQCRAQGWAALAQWQLGEAGAPEASDIGQLISLAEAQPWNQEAWRDFLGKVRDRGGE